VRHGRICVKQRRGPSALADILVELRAKVTQNKRAAEAKLQLAAVAGGVVVLWCCLPGGLVVCATVGLRSALWTG